MGFRFFTSSATFSTSFDGPGTTACDTPPMLMRVNPSPGLAFRTMSSSWAAALSNRVVLPSAVVADMLSEQSSTSTWWVRGALAASCVWPGRTACQTGSAQSVAAAMPTSGSSRASTRRSSSSQRSIRRRCRFWAAIRKRTAAHGTTWYRWRLSM